MSLRNCILFLVGSLTVVTLMLMNMGSSMVTDWEEETAARPTFTTDKASKGHKRD